MFNRTANLVLDDKTGLFKGNAIDLKNIQLIKTYLGFAMDENKFQNSLDFNGKNKPYYNALQINVFYLHKVFLKTHKN